MSASFFGVNRFRSFDPSQCTEVRFEAANYTRFVCLVKPGFEIFSFRNPGNSPLKGGAL